MNELTLMQVLPIEKKEYNGQPVVTFRDIDAIHQKPEGSARKNFNNNKRHFVEGVDFYTVQGGVKNLPIPLYEGQKVFTQTGYLMIVKSFTDDLSWAIQRELVNGYFAARRAGYTFMGTGVIPLADAAQALGISKGTAAYRITSHGLGMGDALLLEGANLTRFRSENPGYRGSASRLWILSRRGFEKLKT